MEPEQIALTAEDDSFQIPPSEVPLQNPLQNPKWVGLIMAWFLPGSAHFLAGQRQTGVIWLFTWFLLQISLFILVSISGAVFFYAAVFCLAAFFLYLIALLASSWRSTRRLGCFGWLLFIGAALLFGCAAGAYVYVIKTYVVEAFRFNGMSMAPTLIAPSESVPGVKRPDRVFVNKWIYRMSEPQRGDIVIFKRTDQRDNTSTIMSKRVIGLPGETVDIESPYVLINGERLTDPPIFAKIANQQDGFTGYCTAQEMDAEGVPLPLTLGPNEYFLMGDNSQRSFDSRFLGPVLRQNITGKVIRIYYPFDRIREIE
ncbi:MAG: signal peptidase I [Planctomycetaceae bacterium]|nr:signal peptidase I [Planctomycetaceae bacterium]